MPRQKVLITGIYGLIGNVIYRRLLESPERYDVYGLSRRPVASDRIGEITPLPDDHFFLGDLANLDAVQHAVTGMDVVIHMAADPSGEHGWESLLNSNLVGAYNIFEACRLAGVKRVVYASSVQVSFGYRDAEPYKTLFDARYDDVDPTEIPIITHKDLTRPINLYAASKVWGEGLAHVYAYRHGMSCIVLRIGWVLDEDQVPEAWGEAVWSSKRDIAQIIQQCVAAPDDVHFDVFYGVSDNTYNWLDFEHAREVLGYAPQDGMGRDNYGKT
jgi:uronate dehydrogenase